MHADHFISLNKTPTKNKRFHHIPISRYSCTCSISSQCRNRQDVQKKVCASLETISTSSCQDIDSADGSSRIWAFYKLYVFDGKLSQRWLISTEIELPLSSENEVHFHEETVLI